MQSILFKGELLWRNVKEKCFLPITASTEGLHKHSFPFILSFVLSFIVFMIPQRPDLKIPCATVFWSICNIYTWPYLSYDFLTFMITFCYKKESEIVDPSLSRY